MPKYVRLLDLKVLASLASRCHKTSSNASLIWIQAPVLRCGVHEMAAALQRLPAWFLEDDPVLCKKLSPWHPLRVCVYARAWIGVRQLNYDRQKAAEAVP